ncbi:MAG: multicopper oxidase domain-containing protein [Terriglobales bacterium]|jgi:FtsP/CotA-like multicopper oxidase with cupredoxin domain
MITRKSVQGSTKLLLGLAFFALATFGGFAQTSTPCPRFVAGSQVTPPPDLYSQNGVLTVNFNYETTTDADGRTLYCFMTPEGLESPTLHVKPGDQLIINLTNTLGPSAVEMQIDAPNCGASGMTATSVNMHFHGTNSTPVCGGDDAVKTLVNSGQSFTYTIAFPTNEPPGLYWYHPHVHGISSPAVQGGASGAIEVEGIQNLQPAVAGLPQRFLLVRDQNVAGNPPPTQTVPSWDVTLNYVPIPYPNYPPANLSIRPLQKEFWRVGNLCADTIMNLQLLYDGVPQTMQLVARDAVPLGSQDGAGEGTLMPVTNILIPPAGRAEFIITGPPLSYVKNSAHTAMFVTEAINTGLAGDSDPPRPLAKLQASLEITEPAAVPAVNGVPSPPRFADLAGLHSFISRSLYFSEVAGTTKQVDKKAAHMSHHGSHTRYVKSATCPPSCTELIFLITVDGQGPKSFNPNNPPAIVTTQGSVEDWTIRNQTLENHEFHVHQIHFLVLSQNNFEINGTPTDQSVQGQYLDTVQIPFWDGNPDHPYPSVTLRMDFRGPDTGLFVYHCHILDHEDGGMMAMIQVNPAGTTDTKGPDNGAAAKKTDEVQLQPAKAMPGASVAVAQSK